MASKKSRPRVLSVCCCLPISIISAAVIPLSLHGYCCHGLQPQSQHQQHQQTMHEIRKSNNSLVGRSVLDSCDCNVATTDCNDNTTTRRKLVRRLFGAAAMTTTVLVNVALPSLSSASTTTIATTTAQNDDDSIRHPFVYSESWKGTKLNRMSLEDATNSGAYTREGNNSRDNSGGDVCCYWTMGRWPDPALRIPAKTVDPSLWLKGAASSLEQPTKLQLAASILRDTARREGAVGLAAQQCGVDARMVFLSSSGSNGGDDGGGVGGLSGRRNNNNGNKSDNDIVLVNPRIVARSPESSMKVWTEECLVLPPTFRATVLRDDWIEVEYDVSFEYRSQQPQQARNGKIRTQSLVPSSEELQAVQLSSSWAGSSQDAQTSLRRRFVNEQSRCLQHELDHDRGILITDHVGLEELENSVMRTIEAEGHDRRQGLAYSRM